MVSFLIYQVLFLVNRQKGLVLMEVIGFICRNKLYSNENSVNIYSAFSKHICVHIGKCDIVYKLVCRKRIK